ncbi:hypothetical protein RKD18_005228 [Streptomyces phaeoluteigriseus]
MEEPQRRIRALYGESTITVYQASTGDRRARRP